MEVFYALYINFHSFIQTPTSRNTAPRYPFGEIGIARQGAHGVCGWGGGGGGVIGCVCVSFVVWVGGGGYRGVAGI